MESIAEAARDPRFPYHVYLHDGIAYTPDVTAMMIQDVQDFPVGDSDVFVAGFPKSGTNWLNITLTSLYPHRETTKGVTRGAVPELTVPSRPAIGFRGFAECLAAASPRLTKTHVPYDHMPRALRQGPRGQAIYITRNPKDVCESYFGQLSSWCPADWGWSQHLDAFIAGNVFFGSWLRNVTSWHAYGSADNVLHIGFEQMQRDKRGTIEGLSILSDLYPAARSTGSLPRRNSRRCNRTVCRRNTSRKCCDGKARSAAGKSALPWRNRNGWMPPSDRHCKRPASRSTGGLIARQHRLWSCKPLFIEITQYGKGASEQAS